jgi:hypothetical protein
VTKKMHEEIQELCAELIDCDDDQARAIGERLRLALKTHLERLREEAITAKLLEKSLLPEFSPD